MKLYKIKGALEFTVYIYYFSLKEFKVQSNSVAC